MWGSVQLFVSTGTLSPAFALASAGAGRAHPDPLRGQRCRMVQEAPGVLL